MTQPCINTWMKQSGSKGRSLSAPVVVHPSQKIVQTFSPGSYELCDCIRLVFAPEICETSFVALFVEALAMQPPRHYCIHLQENQRSSSGILDCKDS